MQIVWTDTMSTGHSEVDTQHQELLSQVNALAEALEAGKSEAEIQRMLEFLGQYTKTHFRFEEACFEKGNCPGKEENRIAHETFIQNFERLMEEFQRKGASFGLGMKIYKELSEWLVRHICQVDTHLRACPRRQA